MNIGDGYQGFSEEDFGTMDEALNANKKAMSEYAGSDFLTYIVFGAQQINDNKYGADHFDIINSMKSPNDQQAKFKIFEVSSIELGNSCQEQAH